MRPIVEQPAVQVSSMRSMSTMGRRVSAQSKTLLTIGLRDFRGAPPNSVSTCPWFVRIGRHLLNVANACDRPKMSFYNLYIGDPDDPCFSWEAAGNIPHVLIDLGSFGILDCVEAMHLLQSEKYGGKQLDWGSSGALMNKQRIEEFLKELSSERPWLKHLGHRLGALDDQKTYLLFACET